MRFAGLLSSLGSFCSSFFCFTVQFLVLRKVPELPAETKREEPAQMRSLIYFNLVPMTISQTAVEGEETRRVCVCAGQVLFLLLVFLSTELSDPCPWAGYW